MYYKMLISPMALFKYKTNRMLAKIYLQ